jgi:hypothetical protein
LLFYYRHKYNWVQTPDIEEEKAWCEWIQKNVSEGNEDTQKGEYSIECVLGWSRPRVIRFVIVPFMLAAVGTTTFGLIWSFNIGCYKGDAAGGFTIASYFAALAGGKHTIPDSVNLLTVTRITSMQDVFQTNSANGPVYIRHSPKLDMRKSTCPPLTPPKST